MHSKKIILFVAILLLLAASIGHSLELVYPEDGTFIVHSNFLIIKGGETPELEGLVVEINGLKYSIMPLSETYFDPVENKERPLTDLLVTEAK